MSEVSNIPQLRFPEFNEPWDVKPLTNVYPKIVVGFVGIVSKDYCHKDIGITFIRTLNIKDGWFKNKDFQYVTMTFHNNNKKSQVRNGDILIARVGANMGLVCVVKNLTAEANSANVIIIKKSDNLSSKFYSSYLSSFRGQKQIQRKGAGGAQEVLNISVAKTINVPFTSLSEQLKITSFLTSFDTKIELLSKKQTLLNEYKKGLMQQIFSQSIRFKADDGRDFPDWEEKRLDDIGSFKSGIGFTETEQGGKSGVPFFKVSDMNLEGNQKVMVLANNYVNDEQIVRLNYKTLNKKSVIFAKVGAAVFLERKRIADNFLIDNNMMAFTPTEDIDFIRQWFDTVRLSKYAQVGALPSYNASDLKTIKINIPSLLEQTKIASFLFSTDSKIGQIGKQLDETKQFKKALLQQMFV